MNFTLECEQEDDGRWLAEVVELPGALAYGVTQDEAMVKAALMQGMPSVTAEMKVRFRHPVHVGEKIRIEASLTQTGKKILEASARIIKDDSTLVAEGSSKLLRQDS